MIRLIKQAREVGTSAGVLLPRSWLNRQVVVSPYKPTIKEISKNVIKYLIDENINDDAIGVYLHGSYARGDEDDNSDIDILVVTKKANMLRRTDNYDILFTSKEVLLRNLPTNLHYQSIIHEARALLNKEFLEEIKSRKIKFNPNKSLSEIKNMMQINKESVKFLSENNAKIPDGIMYSIVLRLRELYMIRNLMYNSRYVKRDFIKIIGKKEYSAYLRAKNNKEELEEIEPEDALKLIGLSEKWLKELKNLRKE